jgi:hypothetical protein
MKPNGDLIKLSDKKGSTFRENDSTYKASAMMRIPNNLSNPDGFQSQRVSKMNLTLEHDNNLSS